MINALVHFTTRFTVLILCLFLSLCLESQAEWITPVNASIASDNADNLQVAFSADGTRAVAVWRIGNGGQFLIQGATGRISGSSITWETPVDLSSFGSVNRTPRIAISADGSTAIALWSSDLMSDSTLESRIAQISPSSTTWGSAVTISAAGFPDFSQVRISSNGSKATAIWLGYDGSHFIARTASATITGTTPSWGSVTDRSASGASADNPKIEISSDGSLATAIWQFPISGTQRVQSASAIITGNTQDWSTATELSAAGGDGTIPDFKLSTDGSKATAVWLRVDGSTNKIVQSKSATIIGKVASWGSVTDLSLSGQDASHPVIGLSADGTSSTAFWSRSNGSVAIAQSRSATISGNTATWNATISDLSAVGESATRNKIALSSDGTMAVAVWLRSNGSNDIVQGSLASIFEATANWSAAENISASGRDAENPQVAMSAAGTNSIAMWSRFNGTYIYAQSSLNGIAPTPTPTPLPTNTPTITPIPIPTRPDRICVTGDGSSASKPYVGSYPSQTIYGFPAYALTSTSLPYHIAFVSSYSGFANGPGLLEFRKEGSLPMGTYTRNNAPGKLYVTAGACPATPAPTPTPSNYIAGNISCPLNGICPATSASISKASSSSPQGVSSTSKTAIQTVLVGSDGSYRFDNLAAGTYSIIFNSDGLDLNQSTITVTLEENGSATAPDIEATALTFNDKGCKISNKVKLKVTATSSAKVLKDTVIDQIFYGNILASEKLSASKKTKYISSLSKLEKQVNSSFNKISRIASSLPNATRLSCPKKNLCKRRDYTKTRKSYVAELTKINRVAINIVTSLAKTFPTKTNIAVGKKSLKTIKKQYRKSLSDAAKLPTVSESCRVTD
jgi:hypothetical protein